MLSLVDIWDYVANGSIKAADSVLRALQMAAMTTLAGDLASVT